METELLRKIINIYIDKSEFIPFAIKNYIEGRWCTFTREDQSLIVQLIMLHLVDQYNDEWSSLCNWMLDNIKSTDITWDSSK